MKENLNKKGNHHEKTLCEKRRDLHGMSGVRPCLFHGFYKEFDPDKSCIQIIQKNGAAKP